MIKPFKKQEDIVLLKGHAVSIRGHLVSKLDTVAKFVQLRMTPL
jgi:hypothetical protein